MDADSAPAANGHASLVERTARAMSPLGQAVWRSALGVTHLAPTMRGLFLEFDDPEVERNWAESHDRRAVKQVRYASMFIALLTAASGLIEAWFAPMQSADATLLILRYGVAVPLLLAVAGLTRVPWCAARIQPLTFAGVQGFAWLYAVPGLLAVPRDVLGPLLFVWLFILTASQAAARLRGRWLVASALGVSAAALASVILTRPPWVERTVFLYTLATTLLVLLYSAWQQERSQRREFVMQKQIDLERQKVEELLLHILPRQVADRLKADNRVIADGFDCATVLFSDLVGFTPLATVTPPDQLLAMLDDLVSTFDDLADTLGLEKIKTIGDAYMVAGGLPDPQPDHAQRIARMALQMQAAMAQFNARRGSDLALRIGIHSGPVVAGIVGKHKFVYDLWGDSVNIASRMESHGAPGAIQVSDAAYALLRNDFQFEPRGTIEVKGKGEMKTWWLVA